MSHTPTQNCPASPVWAAGHVRKPMPSRPVAGRNRRATFREQPAKRLTLEFGRWRIHPYVLDQAPNGGPEPLFGYHPAGLPILDRFHAHAELGAKGFPCELRLQTAFQQQLTKWLAVEFERGRIHPCGPEHQVAKWAQKDSLPPTRSQGQSTVHSPQSAEDEERREKDEVRNFKKTAVSQEYSDSGVGQECDFFPDHRPAF
jgi:hypothetical protein